MKNNFPLLALLLFTSLFLASCGDDDEDPMIPEEEEVITTLTYTLTAATGATVTLTFQDLDGDGGNDPTITGGTLAANAMYTGSLELLNESESPSEDITEEIAEEDAEHQFFFDTNISGLTVSYADEDGNGDPVGLTSTLTTGEAGSGTLTITLRHEPDKSGSGVSGGDITNAGGETDIEVTFPVTIEE